MRAPCSPRHTGTPRFARLAAGALLAAGVLTACSGGTASVPGPASTSAPVTAQVSTSSPAGGPASSTVTSTVGTSTSTATVEQTVTSRAPGSQILAQAPPSTPLPEPVAGSCPYLTDDEVADINGQRTGQTSVTAVNPYPICTFTRSDGGWLATVRFIAADTPQAAAAAVDQHVPIDTSDPASQPAGWTGGSTVLQDRSVYAVAKGTTAVVAESNQLQTVKGRQMVITAIARLGL